MKQLKKKKLSGPKGYVSPPQKGAIPIVLSINDDYVSYAGVTICSIKEHAPKSRLYDIYVMYTRLTTESIRKLEALSEDHFRVQCIDVSSYLNGYVLEDKMNKKLWYISQETYYRFLIPDIFKGYDKIIYLDADLIVRDDLANLYNTELGNDLLGGCYDSLYRKEANYARNVLKIDPHFYINAGVLLIHAKLWRNEKIGNKCFKALSKYAGIIKYQDQDILNIVCQNRIRLIDHRWNFIYSLWIGFNPEYLKYLKNNLFDKKDLKVIHYTWWQKPWICPENEMADIWWLYAWRSPFYKEIILKKRVAPFSLSCKSPSSAEIIKKIQIDDPYIYPILVQYTKEAFLSLISWGKKRRYYSESMRVLKAIIGQRIENNCLSKELSCENRLLLRKKYDDAVRQKRSFLLKVKRCLAKKILIVTFSLNDTGCPLMFFYLAQELHQRGYNVFVLSWGNGRHEEDLKKAKIPYLVSNEFFNGSQKTEELLSFFDVVISGRIPKMYFPSQEYKFIWWEHGLLDYVSSSFFKKKNLKNGHFLTELKFVTSQAKDVVFVSELQQKKLAELRQLPSEIIYNGVKPTGIILNNPIVRQIQRAKKAGKTTFITVGYVDPIKGQDILIKAVKQLPKKYRQKAVFFLIGAEQNKEYARLLRKKSKKITEIIWAGTVIHEEVGGIYESADVLLVPSRSDTAPLVVQEAAEHRMPAVITDNVGSTYITQNGKSGFIVPVEDSKTLSKKIRYFIDYPDKIKEFGKMSQENYDKYSLFDIFMQKWEDKISRKLKEIKNQR